MKTIKYIGAAVALALIPVTAWAADDCCQERGAAKRTPTVARTRDVTATMSTMPDPTRIGTK